MTGVSGGVAAVTAVVPTGETPVCREVFEGMGLLGLIERYRTGSRALDGRVLELEAGAFHRAFGGEEGVGLWSCSGVLGHIADGELVNALRLRRVVAEDGPELADWDDGAFMRAGLYEPATSGVGGASPGGAVGGRPAAGFVAVVHTLRLWMGQFLATVHAEAFEGPGARRCLHARRGEMTLRGLLEHATWHLEYHAWYLARKLDVLVGERSAEGVAGGGCGPGCGCVGRGRG